MRKNKSLAEMFSCCKSLISLPDISKWKFLNLESIGKDDIFENKGSFYGCSSLKSLPDISK